MIIYDHLLLLDYQLFIHTQAPYLSNFLFPLLLICFLVVPICVPNYAMIIPSPYLSQFISDPQMYCQDLLQLFYFFRSENQLKIFYSKGINFVRDSLWDFAYVKRLQIDGNFFWTFKSRFQGVLVALVIPRLATHFYFQCFDFFKYKRVLLVVGGCVIMVDVDGVSSDIMTDNFVELGSLFIFLAFSF